jgi:hypothetical protein
MIQGGTSPLNFKFFGEKMIIPLILIFGPTERPRHKGERRACR